MDCAAVCLEAWSSARSSTATRATRVASRASAWAPRERRPSCRRPRRRRCRPSRGCRWCHYAEGWPASEPEGRRASRSIGTHGPGPEVEKGLPAWKLVAEPILFPTGRAEAGARRFRCVMGCAHRPGPLAARALPSHTCRAMRTGRDPERHARSCHTLQRAVRRAGVRTNRDPGRHARVRVLPSHIAERYVAVPTGRHAPPVAHSELASKPKVSSATSHRCWCTCCAPLLVCAPP